MCSLFLLCWDEKTWISGLLWWKFHHACGRMILLFPNQENSGTGGYLWFMGFSHDKHRFILYYVQSLHQWEIYHFYQSWSCISKVKFLLLPEGVLFLSVINSRVTNITWKPGRWMFPFLQFFTQPSSENILLKQRTTSGCFPLSSHH